MRVRAHGEGSADIARHFTIPYPQVAVMRRRADGWINATHILKVVGLDKPQRTRVLERDVQKGTHEKVQGGYGKYQGECMRSFLLP